jgi:hypothetical protein
VTHVAPTGDTHAPRRFDLHAAFAGTEETLSAALRTARQVAGHPTVQGDGTEMHWQEVLKASLPNRYQVSRAIVIDSKGGQSEQIDLVVRDQHFSPLFWEWGGHLYVPAESVYAVFEVKPELSRDNILYAAAKISSVRNLHRTSSSFGWAMGTMPARNVEELPPILGGFLAGASRWSPAFADPFRLALADGEAPGALDLGCVLGHGAFEIPHGAGSETVAVSDPGIALVSFMLTLLRRLQGLGSAPGIDYDAYGAWINGRAAQSSGALEGT